VLRKPLIFRAIVGWALQKEEGKAVAYSGVTNLLEGS
jgi:hypothetical protein